MTARSRAHGNGGAAEGGHREAGGAERPERSAGRVADTAARAEQSVAAVARQGRASGDPERAYEDPSGHTLTPEDLRLQDIIRRYEQLGDEPPTFNIQANDDAYDAGHTIDRHGPQLPLRRQPDLQTVEGRIFGEHGWGDPENKSYQWSDHTTMNREVNKYVSENWESIRDDLAFDEFHQGLFDADHRVGRGFYNKGMYGVGPRESEYSETSLVRIRIRVAEGSDPAVPFIVSAFPAGLG